MFAFAGVPRYQREGGETRVPPCDQPTMQKGKISEMPGKISEMPVFGNTSCRSVSGGPSTNIDVPKGDKE